MDAAEGNSGFLPLAEAAARLGLSRLKLREAIAKGVIPARRDNEGRWRVDMAAMPGDLRAATRAVAADPGALMESLFDEIEELTTDLDAAQGLTERWTTLAGAQGAALDKAMAALEQAAVARDRFADLTGRALTAATESEARATALQATADRAIGLLDRAAGAIERMKDEVDLLKTDSGAKQAAIAAHAAQLDRLFTLSEQTLDKAADKTAEKVARVPRRGPGLLARMFGTAPPRKG